MSYLTRAIPAFLAVTFGVLASARAQAPGSMPAKVSGTIPLYFTKRPATDGLRRMLAPETAAPVTIKLVSKPTASDVSALQALGVRVKLRRDGTPRGFGHYLVADMPEPALELALCGHERKRRARFRA